MIETLNTGRLNLAYESFGDPGDPPVVLVMGLGTQMIAWPDAFCEALARHGYRVTRFDNRDAGLSDHLPDLVGPGAIGSFLGRPPSYRLTDLAADTRSLIEGLGHSEAHVVGISMGGCVAQTLALMHPSVVRTLTSISSSTGRRLAAIPRVAIMVRTLSRRPAPTRERAIEDSVATFDEIRSPGYPWDEAETRRLAGIAYDRGYDPAGTGRQLAAILAAPDRTPGLRRLRIPTLVLHGEADRLIPVSGGRATAAAIPDSVLRTFPGVGHEIPGPLRQAYADEIADHLRRSA